MEQYVTYNGKEGSGVITTLTKGKQYKIIEDLETSICIRNDRGQKKYYYRQYFTDTPSPAKAEQPFNRDENSVEGKAAIEFYEWLQRSSMAKAEVPINIKWRMFVDQKNVKQKNNQ